MKFCEDCAHARRLLMQTRNDFPLECTAPIPPWANGNRMVNLRDGEDCPNFAPITPRTQRNQMLESLSGPGWTEPN